MTGLSCAKRLRSCSISDFTGRLIQKTAGRLLKGGGRFCLVRRPAGAHSAGTSPPWPSRRASVPCLPGGRPYPALPAGCPGAGAAFFARCKSAHPSPSQRAAPLLRSPGTIRQQSPKSEECLLPCHPEERQRRRICFPDSWRLGRKKILRCAQDDKERECPDDEDGGCPG